MRMDKLTSRFQQSLAEAQSLALGRDHQFLEPAHVMLAMLDGGGGSVRPLLLKAGADVNKLRAGLLGLLDGLPKVEGTPGDKHVSNDLNRVLNVADKLAQQRGDQFISSELLDMNWSPRCCASLSATLSTRFRSLETCLSPGVPSTFGRPSSSPSRPARSLLTSAPAFSSSGRTEPPPPSSIASITCAGSRNWWSRPSASDCASASDCWKRLVSLSMRMATPAGVEPLVCGDKPQPVQGRGARASGKSGFR